jgi:hypothetical protein
MIYKASYLLTQVNTEHIEVVIAVFSATLVGAVLPSKHTITVTYLVTFYNGLMDDVHFAAFIPTVM